MGRVVYRIVSYTVAFVELNSKALRSSLQIGVGQV